ncbi:tetratricopeptide repeat protein [Snuella sedimenti]|nr:tetratricopeptide repeat protein [Snuella sedimenti]
MKIKLFVILTAIPILTNAQANKLYRKAMRSTDLNEKIELFNQVIKLEPKKLNAYFYRAIAKNDLGDYSGAIVDYSKILIDKPDADTYFNRGNSRYSLQDYEGAKQDYQKALDIDPDFIDALYSLASSKFELNDYNGAIEDLSKVIEAAPYHAEAYKLRATSYTILKKHEMALKDYSFLVLIYPNAETYFDRGFFYMTLNYHEQARSDFSKSIRHDKKNAFTYFYRGVSSLHLGQYNKAIADFSINVSLDPSDFDALIGLAIAYNKLNDLPNAQLNFDEAKKILAKTSSIKNTKALEFYANTYWHQNQYYFFVNGVKDLD